MVASVLFALKFAKPVRAIANNWEKWLNALKSVGVALRVAKQWPETQIT